MKKLYYLLFSLIFIIFLVPKTYALENYDTYYEFSITNDYYEREITFGTTTLIDFYTDLISYYEEHSSVYHMIIQSDTIYLIPKATYSNSTLYFDIHGANSGRSNSFTSSEYFNNVSKFIFPHDGSTWNILTTNWYNHLKDCLNGLSCNTSSSSAGFIYNYGYNEVVLLDNRNATISSLPFNNIDNFLMLNYQPYYYSSTPLMFRPNSNYVNLSTTFYKSVNYYNLSFKSGDYLQGYLDSQNFTDVETLEEIGNIFIGNIPVSNISSFRYNSEFYYEDDLFVDSFIPRILFFGRVNNTTYYSYEKISCTNNTSINKDNSLNKATIVLDNFSCSSNLSSYDNIYIRLYFDYDSNTNSVVRNYKSNLNFGHTTRLKNSTANYLNVYIYEFFENLSSSFSILLSSDFDNLTSYFRSHDESIVSLYVDRNGNKLGQLPQNPISYGYSFNSNALIYDTLYDYVHFDNLELFVHYNTILSVSDNDTYTYYDSSNTITTSTIINEHTLVNINDYDITYYNNVVSNFIDSLSEDITSFSLIIQTCYNTAPEFIKLFIYVVFILICILFIYRLIQRR